MPSIYLASMSKSILLRLDVPACSRRAEFGSINFPSCVLALEPGDQASLFCGL